MKRLLSIFTLCATLVSVACPGVYAADTITYSNNVKVVYEEDFEYYDNSLSHSSSDTTTSYASITALSGGKGTNTSTVGVFYDSATTGDATARVTDDGAVDQGASKVAGKPAEFMYVDLAEEFADAEHIRVEFKYYNAKNAIKYATKPTAENPAGVLGSTIRDTLNFALRDKLDSAEQVRDYFSCAIQSTQLIPNNAGGERLNNYAKVGEWMSVQLDAYIEKGAGTAGRNKVSFVLRGNGYTSQTFTQLYTQNFRYFALNFSEYGGKFYLDDLKISVIEDRPESLETAAAELTFDKVSAGTNNTQDNVYQSWTNGFLTSVPSGEDTYDVEWSSDNENAIKPDGTVIQSPYAKTVKLTAKIKSRASDTMYALKTFTVRVAPVTGATPDEALEKFAEEFITKQRLSDEVTETSSAITKDLKNLITEDTTAGITVEWESDNPSVLSNKGVVSRPWYVNGNAEVTLTAKLRMTGAADKVVLLSFTVEKLPDPKIVLPEAIAAISITTEDYNKITKRLTLPTEYGFAVISWTSTDNSVIAADGTVTRGDTEQTVTLTATAEFCGETETKDYTVTVLPATKKMIEADIALIQQNGWDALTDNITLPLKGTKYGSEFNWSADSDYFVIDNEDSAAAAYVDVKRPPNSAGNETVTLTLRATSKTYGADSVTRAFTVTVLCQESDLTLAERGAALLNFDYIAHEDDTADAVKNNLSLPKGFSFDPDVKVTWQSSNPALVTDEGEVIRPYGTTASNEVTLTATVTKNYSSAAPVSITFTVKPFESVGELLGAAANALTFSSISAEEIDAVTQDLTLMTDWKYGTEIGWSVSSESAAIAVSGTTGVVTRPDWGQTAAPTVLTAKITYPATGQSTDKKFIVSVLEKDYMEVYDAIVSEDFDEWVDTASSFITDGGTWTTNSTDEAGDYYSHLYEDDNHVLCIDKTQDTPINGYLFMAHDTMEVFGVYEFKFFIPNDNQSERNSVAILSNSAQIPIVLNAKDCVISANTYISSSAAAMKFADGAFTKGQWNTLRIEGNVEKKRYHLYLNDVCITENGTVTLAATGEAVDTLEGVPFYYYSDSTRTADLKKARFYTDSSKYYIDDFSVRQKLVYTEAQKNAAEEWDRAFRNANDITDIKTDLVIPNVAYSGIAISYDSDNTRVVNEWGKVSDVTEATDVVFTAIFDNQVTKYRKNYNLTVTRGLTYSTPKTDLECAKSDLAAAKEYLQKNYNLNNLTQNIDVSALQGKNGAKVTISSSNVSSLSDTGVVTPGSSAVTLTLTITAEKGAERSSGTLSVTVGKQSVTQAPTDGGFKISYGTNSVSQVKIDSALTETGKQEESSSFMGVPRDHWAYTYIREMVEKGIMNGTENGEAEPEREITREEFIKMLVIAMGAQPSNALCGFTDADENAWYAPYLAAAKRLGILQGYADGSVGIGQKISRQDMATMIYRATSLAAAGGSELFADDESISDYAQEAVYTLKEAGIINGNEAFEFAPGSFATRAETAAMFYRALQQNIFETER